MKLKVVKPKPKYYKISYAMLSNLIKEEEETTEKTPVEAPVVAEKPAETKFANKYDKLVDEAIRKRLIDESDREMKLLELQTLSDEEFEAYANEVHEEEFMDISNVEEKPKQEVEMTEAEKALAKIKQTGAIIGDFSDLNNAKVDTSYSVGGSETRSLGDIKQTLDMSTFCGEDNLMDGAMDILASSLRQQQQKKVANVQSPMSNLKGLTKPIVHEQSQFKSDGKSMVELFSSMNWTTIGGSR